MIIGIDGRELEGKPTGVGSYLLNILRELEVPAGMHIQIYFKNEIPAMDEWKVEPVLLNSDRRNFFWQNGILARELRKRNVKLFFTPTANSIAFFAGIQAVAVLDLSYFNYPEWFRTRERWVRQWSAWHAVRKARRIYVISNHVRAEIRRRFGVSDEKMLLTPIGMQQRKVDEESREMLRKSYGYESCKVILYVGSVFQRRHLPVLIEAMTKLGEDTKLVVIGENRTFPHLDLNSIAKKKSVDARVLFLQYASTKVVQDYYKMANVFVYLSTYEGFGIPPLEAMSYGVPVVLSRTPAMDEVYQDSAEFAAIDPDAVAGSIRRVLEDTELRERLIHAGLSKVKRSRWSETADLILRDWEHLLAARS